MSAVRYEFRFNEASQKQREFGMLANMSVDFWIGEACVLSTNSWSVRESKDGGQPWISAPSYKYTSQGETKYRSYVYIWPTKEGGNQDRFNDFKNQAVAAYVRWSRENGQGRDSFSPPPPPARNSGPSLPPGWSSQVDTQTGKRYYRDPSGQAYWEGDDRLKTLLNQGSKAPSGPSIPDANDIFSDSPPGFDSPPGGPSLG